MIDELIARIFTNQWLVFLTITLLLLLVASFGQRVGLALFHRDQEAAKGLGNSVQGAVLGLLGLLLGFSFAMAVGRYDARRALVVTESNSIGTTWLRSDFLNTPDREEIKKLLEDYTRLRVNGYKDLDDPAKLVTFQQQASHIHRQLWAKGAAAARANPSPLTTSFIASLNETIDLDASRLAAMRNHVPSSVWLLLVLVASCGAWSGGYSTGTAGTRSLFNQWIFPLLIGTVITLIVDIDRPHKGIISVSQKPMQELLNSFEPHSP